MKGQREFALLVSLAIFIGAPYLPNSFLQLTVNTYAGVAFLLGITLYAVRQDMVLGLAVFLSAGALFLENRKRLVAAVSEGSSATAANPLVSTPAPVAELSKPAEPVLETEVHPVFEAPSRESHDFKPSDEDHTGDFKPVGESINEKQPLELVPSNRSQTLADMFEKEGLGHLNGVGAAN